VPLKSGRKALSERWIARLLIWIWCLIKTPKIYIHKLNKVRLLADEIDSNIKFILFFFCSQIKISRTKFGKPMKCLK
jgi:hypothetical protein